MNKYLAALIAGIFLSGTPVQGETITYTVEEDIEDVLFAVESEIIGRGLKIDTVNHVGAMLDRTALDVGASEKIFFRAEVFNFCSAVISRKVMEVDPANLSFCPYGIFIYTTPDALNMTTVGHDVYPDGEMQLVQELLNGIVKDALGVD